MGVNTPGQDSRMHTPSPQGIRWKLSECRCRAAVLRDEVPLPQGLRGDQPKSGAWGG